MRCTTAGRQLQLYSDGRLAFQQMRALEAHLADCAACREELWLLETFEGDLDAPAISEPADMHQRIMQRVTLAPQAHPSQSPFFSWRPSLPELLAAILLATVATLGSILQQPALRSLLPIANGHDSLSLAFINLVHMLTTMSSSTLAAVLWIAGTILGVCITLAFAGDELRSQWLKAMMDRLPER